MELATIDPIPLPDLRRLTIPSLPQWLARSSDAVKLELQPTEEGFRDIQTLPGELLPNPAQRQMIEEHLDSLLSCLDQTPSQSDEAEASTAAAVTNLLMVLPSSKKTEFGSEARTDVYLDVLDDVPWWAVKSACRRWHRHECGKDERGEQYDYRWVPDPGTLRRIAYGETWQIKDRISALKKVLDAQPYVDCTKQLEDGRAAMAGLAKLRTEGRLDSTVTFAQAIEIANKSAQQAAE